jgi:hypothetical protein
VTPQNYPNVQRHELVSARKRRVIIARAAAAAPARGGAVGLRDGFAQAEGPEGQCDALDLRKEYSRGNNRCKKPRAMKSDETLDCVE